jgi:hypothetical protein
MEDIRLPYAGETFNDPTLVNMIARLQMLKEVGYRIPDWVFEEMWDELRQDVSKQEGQTETV